MELTKVMLAKCKSIVLKGHAVAWWLRHCYKSEGGRFYSR
jgi:hypothetical protein